MIYPLKSLTLVGHFPKYTGEDIRAMVTCWFGENLGVQGDDLIQGYLAAHGGLESTHNWLQKFATKPRCGLWEFSGQAELVAFCRLEQFSNYSLTMCQCPSGRIPVHCALLRLGLPAQDV